MGAYVTVAKTSDIAVGSFKAVEVNGKRLLICHTEEGFFAVDDTCTHDDGPLADGWLEGVAIECPRHGARFDVRTGKVLCLPAAVDIHSYPTQVEGDTIKVQLTR
ncbi:MAG: non-heme iron oxygenase ferredoxin subunit [Candidatus Omnitrophica bacterium]|nr:non-heme iron oxygenase ferredoxin subunit [Candidatus Omnitrophota bacterium]MBI2174747.1 non-heme iron oxygenase ferredoxin subunit [Candidatus Omnitrophota bacterium]MBI3010219.1 non-heme iron oxygenase ferredoxin subunit [Candidatus Omnitrophota bacterium]